MYRLVIMIGLLSLLLFIGLVSSFTYSEKNYDLKNNNIIYTSNGFTDNKEFVKSLISEKLFQNLIKNNQFVKVESQLKEIKSIESIDIYFNDRYELGIKLTDRTPIANLKYTNSLIDINGNIFEKDQSKNDSLPIIIGKISEMQISKIIKVVSAFKKDKFLKNKLKEIWFKNDNLYVKIKNLNLDVMLGDQNKIENKLKMLKGFYVYQIKNLNKNKYKQLNLVYVNRLVAIKK